MPAQSGPLCAPLLVEVAELLADAQRLGFGEPVAISAETGEGMTELYEALQPHVDGVAEARQAAVALLEVGGVVGLAPGGGFVGWAHVEGV